jgi:hypothetical protein
LLWLTAAIAERHQDPAVWIGPPEFLDDAVQNNLFLASNIAKE